MVAWTFDNRSTDLSGTANDPTHDASGNMTADSSNTYIYDAWNRLVEVRDRGDDSLIAEYEYDGQKRRIEKTVDETETDYFYNDNWQLVEERVDGSVAYEYAWDQRYIDAPIARFDAAGDAVYYTNDANMNVTSLVEESGTVIERYAYSPYGERTVLDADWSADADGVSDVDNTLGHQGLHLDTESALYYNRNRYYSPALGRFITRDPLGYVDGMSVYEYAKSTAVNMTDPEGLECNRACCACVATPWLCRIEVSAAAKLEGGCKKAKPLPPGLGLGIGGEYVCWARARGVRFDLVHDTGLDVSGCHLQQDALSISVADGSFSKHSAPRDSGPPNRIQRKGFLEYHGWWYMDSPGFSVRLKKSYIYSFTAWVWVQEQPWVRRTWSLLKGALPPKPIVYCWAAHRSIAS
ncbi:MAG: hypothetical protein GVY16_06340 [Planctomycetes bacterium]|nr:hypothetical protein [Planctomycetota bacterium]